MKTRRGSGSAGEASEVLIQLPTNVGISPNMGNVAQPTIPISLYAPFALGECLGFDAIIISFFILAAV
jgi:hypothetical protein